MEARKSAIRTVGDLIASSRNQLMRAMPKHLDADRLLRVALTTIQDDPNLLACTPSSLIRGVMQSAQLGLEVGGALGLAYLIPYNKEATFQIGYRGLISLALRGGDVVDIHAAPVYEGEDYREWTDEKGPHFRHVPGEGPYKPEQLRCVYMIATMKSGATHVGRMWGWEIELVRARSRARSGPWQTDYVEMAKKTVVRRESKYLPLAVESQAAISDDERRDLGIVDVTPAQAALPEAAARPGPTDLDQLTEQLKGTDEALRSGESLASVSARSREETARQDEDRVPPPGPGTVGPFAPPVGCKRPGCEKASRKRSPYCSTACRNQDRGGGGQCSHPECTLPKTDPEGAPVCCAAHWEEFLAPPSGETQDEKEAPGAAQEASGPPPPADQDGVAIVEIMCRRCGESVVAPEGSRTFHCDGCGETQAVG